MDGRCVLSEMYGTPLAITSSGNSQAVANTPDPLMDPMFEKPSAAAGARMWVLSNPLITNCPIDPKGNLSRWRAGKYGLSSRTENPLNTTLLIEEPCKR